MGGKLLGLRDCYQDGGETSEFPPHDGGEIIEKTSILGACGAFRSKLTFFDDFPPHDGGEITEKRRRRPKMTFLATQRWGGNFQVFGIATKDGGKLMSSPPS